MVPRRRALLDRAGAPGHDAPPRKKRDVQWTRANAREVLPDLPSPQALEAICDIVNRGSRAVLGRLAGPVSDIGPVDKSFLALRRTWLDRCA